MFFRKQNPQIINISPWKTEKEKHTHQYNNNNKNHHLRNALFLCLFLFAWFIVLHVGFGKNDKTARKNDKGVVRTCNANYSVYVYDLPAEFNAGLVADCHNLSVYTDMCPHVANRGLGRPISASSLPGPTPPARRAWFATHQFIAEMIFHARVEAHPCRTRDPTRASLFYVPFYGGLYASSKLRAPDLASRDALALRLAAFLRRQPRFRRREGRDHFLALGRTAWDFTRPPGASASSSGANALLNLPELANVTVLTVERNPWNGKNQKGIPYPSYFHPSTWRDMSTWQSAVRNNSVRPNLFSFVGGPRPAGLEKAAVRERLIRQCAGSARCELLSCVGPGTGCHDPGRVMGVMTRSDFCLQAPGDSFTRRSTFDSVLAGCVPVFFSEHTAYSQYGWYVAGEAAEEWSVFVDEKSPDSERVEAVLAGISRERVERMRERVIDMIPSLTYAHPDADADGGDKGFHDAVDVALSSLSDHLRRRL